VTGPVTRPRDAPRSARADLTLCRAAIDGDDEIDRPWYVMTGELRELD
jgi:hypothetical protein